jgi:hypothetical protein
LYQAQLLPQEFTHPLNVVLILARLQIRRRDDKNASGKTGTGCIGADSQQGCLLRPDSCLAPLLQLCVVGEGIEY